MEKEEIPFATLTEAAALIRSGDASSQQLTELTLGRIGQLNGSLNAYITVTESLAFEQARQADKELAHGTDRGPLHGIPIAIKDLIATKNIRTTCGSKLFENEIPDRDARVVELLREAGAVILGKTGLDELAYGVTSNNPFFGAVKNPWKLDYHPGGSSGGSAAAVAAGLAYGALGTDTGCSVRQPAHCCGIVGFKPTFGLVSKRGVFPLINSMDHVGTLTRSVEDCALMLHVIAGYDPADSESARDSSLPAIDFDPGALKDKKIGVPRAYFFDDCDTEVANLVEGAIGSMRGAGAVIVDVELVDVDQVFKAAGACFAEASSLHRHDLETRPEAFSDGVRQNLARGMGALAVDYLAAQRARREFHERVEDTFANCDVLVTPTSPVPSWPIDQPRTDYAFATWRNTGIFNFTGQPSISVPCGFTEAGLPVGIMFNGRKFDDAKVLKIAYAFEKATNWHLQHPHLS